MTFTWGWWLACRAASSCRRGWRMSSQGSGPEGGAATYLWCGDAACHGLGGDLGCGSVWTAGQSARLDASFRGRLCPAQLGLRVVDSCSFAARERGGMSGWRPRKVVVLVDATKRRLRVFVNFKGACEATTMVVSKVWSFCLHFKKKIRGRANHHGRVGCLHCSPEPRFYRDINYFASVDPLPGKGIWLVVELARDGFPTADLLAHGVRRSTVRRSG
jgi:hypothetical protein